MSIVKKSRQSSQEEVLEVVTRILTAPDDTPRVVMIGSEGELAMNICGDAREIAEWIVTMLTSNPVLFSAVTNRLAQQMMMEMMGLEERTVPEECDDPDCDCKKQGEEAKNEVPQQSESVN